MSEPGLGKVVRLGVAVVGVALVVSACTPRVSTHGAMPDVDVITQIIPQETTRVEVERKLGSPSSVNMFGEETWLYIGESTETVAFFERNVQERSVLIITFDQDGVVSRIDSHGTEEAREIEPIERTTPTVGNEMTFIDQMLGNLNRFRNVGGGGEN